MSIPQVNATPEEPTSRTQRNTLVKLYFPLRTGGDHTDASRPSSIGVRTHGPIIRRQAHGSGILRYVQVHRALDDELCASRCERFARLQGADPYLGPRRAVVRSHCSAV